MNPTENKGDYIPLSIPLQRRPLSAHIALTNTSNNTLNPTHSEYPKSNRFINILNPADSIAP